MTARNRFVVERVPVPSEPPPAKANRVTQVRVPDFHEVKDRVLAALTELQNEANLSGHERLPEFPVLILKGPDAFETRAEKYAWLAFENIRERMRQNPGPAEVGEQITKIAKSARILAVAMVRASSEAMEAINRELDRAALKEAVAAAVQARPGEEARRVEEAYKQSLPYALSPFKLQRELAALAVAARTATPSIAVVERGHGPAPAKAVKKLAEMASDDFAKIVGRPPDYKRRAINRSCTRSRPPRVSRCPLRLFKTQLRVGRPVTRRPVAQMFE
jgi:hypothetical protein